MHIGRGCRSRAICHARHRPRPAWTTAASISPRPLGRHDLLAMTEIRSRLAQRPEHFCATWLWTNLRRVRTRAQATQHFPCPSVYPLKKHRSSATSHSLASLPGVPKWRCGVAASLQIHPGVPLQTDPGSRFIASGNFACETSGRPHLKRANYTGSRKTNAT